MGNVHLLKKLELLGVSNARRKRFAFHESSCPERIVPLRARRGRANVPVYAVPSRKMVALLASMLLLL